MSYLVVLLIPIASFLAIAGAIEDYCVPALCPENVQHIACGNTDGQFQQPACGSNAVQVDLSDGALQQLLVLKHNQFRQQVASGQLANYLSASSMQQMYWDSDLAYVAGFNARTCQMQHDHCRATTRYPLSGQNIAYISATDAFVDDTVAINHLLDKWFAEHTLANMSIIRRFRGPTSTNNDYGHFTELVQQRNGHVGCAMVRYTSTDGGWFSTLLTCNYEWNNMRDEAVYEEGPPASNCTTAGVSGVYTSLCA